MITEPLQRSAAAVAETTGLRFIEWNTKIDETGTSYTPGTQFALPEGNVILYAIWDTNTYQISYDGNGNTGAEAPGNQSVAYSAVATLQGKGLLARKGYDFLGWSTQQNATVQEYDGGGTMDMGAADVTLYAVWSPHEYTLEYNANSATGGDLPTGPELTTYGTTIIVKDNQVTTPLTKTGYSFVGWNTSVNGSGFDYVKDSTFLMPDDDVMLYAQWVINSYLVTFSSNELTYSTQNVVYSEKVTEPIAPSRPGYTFGGWYTDSGLITAASFQYTVTADTTLCEVDGGYSDNSL